MGTQINPDQFGKVAVLYGGKAAEREVSLMSGQGVYEALRSQGVDAYLFDTATEDLSQLQHFDRAFIALHGRYGEDGTIQGLLELYGIPYTGCGVMASAIAMDKIMTKKIWLQAGLPTADFRIVQNIHELMIAAWELGCPLILKAPHEGSTLGLQKIDHVQQLEAAYAKVAAYDQTLLAEKFIQGRELTVAVFGKGENAYALPIVEIIAPEGDYNFNNKYYSNETRYECPAPLSADLQQRIEQTCVAAYRALDCEGWARVDLLLNAQQEIFLLEINTSPGMTSHSLVPMSARQYGLDYAQLCLLILQQANCKTWLRKDS